MMKKYTLFKKILLLAFILIIYLLVAEQIVRVESFGPNAFSPKLMTNIKLSMTAPMIDGKCDLKVNYSQYYKGAYLQYNSLGLRDKEYPFEKDNRTFRIALVGDSNTQGIGVEYEDLYHTIFEERLNNRSINKTYEVLNFGRGGIQTVANDCYFKKTVDALHFNPDVVIIQVYHLDKLFLNNLTNYKRLEEYRNNTLFIIMFLRDNHDQVEKSQNLTDYPIISLNVSWGKKERVYPADWHPNEEIHRKLANSLYDYFILNEEYIFNRTRNLTMKQDLPEFIIPPASIPHEKYKSGFFRLFYVEKIEKRFETIFKI